MKIKNILSFSFSLVIFSIFIFNRSLALQIKNVNYSANNNNDRWIEIFNDGSDIPDFTSNIYKIVDSEDERSHGINELLGGVSFLASTSVFISPSTNIPNGSGGQVFRSPYKLNKTSGYIILFANGVRECFSYGGVICPETHNEGIVEEGSTSSISSETKTSTTEKIVYIYIPENNQHKYGDIQILLPEEKIVPALAEVEYTVKVTDSQKKAITDLDFHWSFGDGGEQSGKDALYTYIYPGEYILIASADGYTGGGKARMNVKVVNPDIIISEIGMGEKENFIILKNNTDYDLFLSNFYLSLDGNFYKLPKNLMIAKNKTLKLSGEAIGFKLPANNISLLYPNKNLLISYKPEEIKIDISLATTSIDEENTIFTENILSKVQTFTPKIVTVKAKENSNQKVTISKDLAKSDIGDKTETVYLKRLVLGNGVSDLIGKTQNKKVDTVYKDKSVDTKLINWVKNLIY